MSGYRPKTRGSGPPADLGLKAPARTPWPRYLMEATARRFARTRGSRSTAGAYASRALIAFSSIGDRISLDRAYVDISAKLGGAVVKHGSDVKSTPRSIIDIHLYRTSRSQDIPT